MYEQAVPFSDAVAGYYDDIYPDFESSGVIEFLETLGYPKGAVLEFGIGTGRIGLPLARHGYDVHGVEASTKMIGELRDGKVPWVVRDASFDDAREPNGSARSSGVVLLDDYVDAHYRPVGRDGPVSVWLRRDLAAPPAAGDPEPCRLGPA